MEYILGLTPDFSSQADCVRPFLVPSFAHHFWSYIFHYILLNLEPGWSCSARVPNLWFGGMQEFLLGCFK